MQLRQREARAGWIYPSSGATDPSKHLSPFSVAVRMRYLPRFVHETRGEEQADQSVTETNKQTE